VNANVVKSNHYGNQIDRNTVKPKFTIDLMVFQKNGVPKAMRAYENDVTIQFIFGTLG